MKKIFFRLISATLLLAPSSALAIKVDSIFGALDCPKIDSTLECWINGKGGAFDWALGIVGSIAVVVIALGGVIYMTSGGNPDRVGQAKKLIFNALAGVAILILAKFFLTKIIGVPQ